MSDFLNLLLLPALVYGCIYALVATGFNLLEKSTKILNFAHGSLILWAPLGGLVLANLWGLPGVVGLVGGIVLGVVLGLVVERIAIRPFIGSGDALPWVLSTLGASLILAQLALLPYGGEAEAFPYSLTLTPTHVGPLVLSMQDVLLFGATIGVALVLYVVYTKTRLGRMLTAVAEDFDGARVLGISTSRMSQVAMIASALTAAVAGLILAPLLLVSPDLGLSLTFTGFVAAALGGLGSLRGGFVGGITVGFVIQLTAQHLGSIWTNAALFGVLLVVLLIRPWGLFGRRPVRQV